MNDHGSEQLKTLLKWFRDYNITFEHLNIKSDATLYSGEALGVFAAQDVPEGTTLAVIPKQAVLSVKNSSLRDFMEEHKVGGGLALVFAVMHEMALGTESKWYGYLQSLPRQEYIPLFWEEAELDLLRGTDAEGHAMQARLDTEADYTDEILPLVKENKGQLFRTDAMTLDNFRAAASWIGSRAFGVDDEHGMSMVPLADLFNHKSSIVSLSPQYALEGACLGQDSGSESGDESEQESQNPHQPENSGGSEEGEAASEGQDRDEDSEHNASAESDEEGPWEESRPAICAATSRGEMVDSADFPAQDLRLHMGICGAERDNQPVLEIVAASALSQGQEIFNTFGELGNTELVCKYGFSLPDNPFSSVQLDKDSLLASANKILKKKEFEEKVAYLEEQSDLLDGEAEPFEVLPRGQIGPSLAATARLLGCSAQEWKQARSLDLTGLLATFPDLKKKAEQERVTKEEHESDHKRQKTEAARPLCSGERQEAADQPACQLVNDGGADDEGSLDLANVRLADCNVPAMVVSILQETIQKRLQRCYSGGDIDSANRRLQQALSSKSRGQKISTEIAALTLVVDEMTLLLEAANSLTSKS